MPESKPASKPRQHQSASSNSQHQGKNKSGRRGTGISIIRRAKEKAEAMAKQSARLRWTVSGNEGCEVG